MNENEKSISIVMPCHNCANHITETLNTLISKIKIYDYEIICVENGSTDGTYEIIQKYIYDSGASRISLIQSDKGLGCALRAGIQITKKRFLAFVADDLPFGMQEVESILEHEVEFEANCIGILSKYKNISGLNRSLLRNFMGICFGVIREIILKTRVYDSQGTFMGLSENIKRLASKCKEKGFLMSTEMIFLAKSQGINIIEIPVKNYYSRRSRSTIKVNDVVKMFTGLFRIKKNSLNCGSF